MTIDCPSDCVHLVSSRQNDIGADVRLIVPSCLLPRSNSTAVLPPRPPRCWFDLDHAIRQFAAGHRALVDTDALAALRTLAETYRTQASGIIYEKPLDYLLQRELNEAPEGFHRGIRKEDTQRIRHDHRAR